jgi:hypothetical protein
MPVDMANQMIVAVRSPWVAMYARAADVALTAARMAESFGLNSSPVVFHLRVTVGFPIVRSLL